jgi:hypothetical protein
MADDLQLVQGKSVVAAIGFRATLIYPTDASPGQQPGRPANGPGIPFRTGH